ncbi:putative UPF0389 protein [Halotydeus destructor]|nr:putative UPF0389 protein [Halotydeus destructor]
MSNEGRNYSPSNLERRILVWYKKFPSVEEVPNHVSLATMEKVKSKARIHLNLVLVGIFSVGFFVTALQGRKARDAGHTVEKLNIDWHRQYNDPSNVEKKLPEIR